MSTVESPNPSAHTSRTQDSSRSSVSFAETAAVGSPKVVKSEGQRVVKSQEVVIKEELIDAIVVTASDSPIVISSDDDCSPSENDEDSPSEDDESPKSEDRDSESPVRSSSDHEDTPEGEKDELQLKDDDGMEIDLHPAQPDASSKVHTPDAAEEEIVDKALSSMDEDPGEKKDGEPDGEDSAMDNEPLALESDIKLPSPASSTSPSPSPFSSPKTSTQKSQPRPTPISRSQPKLKMGPPTLDSKKRSHAAIRTSSQKIPQSTPALSQKLPKPPPFSSQKLASFSSQKRSSPQNAGPSSRPRVGSSVSQISIKESDDEADRQPKRVKTSATPSTVMSTTGRNRPTRHQEFWLLDGSVVIRVQKTIFRLHRSTLIEGSPYFAKLLQNPNAQTGEEIDRCQVYVVNDVTVIDFERLLTGIKRGVDFVYDPPPFPMLASILRAARALSFSSLDNFATRTLREMWPSDLAKLTSAKIPHASETVVLAQKCGMPELLKRAFYELLRTSGFGQPDSNPDEDEDIMLVDDDAVEIERVSFADVIRLTKTREKLLLEWHLAVDMPPDPLQFPCPLSQLPAEPAPDADVLQLKNRCMNATLRHAANWIKHVKKSGIYEDEMYDPLCGLDRLMKVDWASEGYCPGCIAAWKEAWMRKKEKLWGNLDLWLGLNPAEP